jgi:hypothetical protein
VCRQHLLVKPFLQDTRDLQRLPNSVSPVHLPHGCLPAAVGFFLAGFLAAEGFLVAGFFWAGFLAAEAFLAAGVFLAGEGFLAGDLVEALLGASSFAASSISLKTSSLHELTFLNLLELPPLSGWFFSAHFRNCLLSWSASYMLSPHASKSSTQDVIFMIWTQKKNLQR